MTVLNLHDLSKLISAIKEKPPDDGFGRCKDHKRELGLYCRNLSCQIAICAKCLAEHKTHDVVDIDDRDVQSEEQNNKTSASPTKGILECDLFTICTIFVKLEEITDNVIDVTYVGNSLEM